MADDRPGAPVVIRHRDYVADREARDPTFKAARAASRPAYERQKARIAKKIARKLPAR